MFHISSCLHFLSKKAPFLFGRALKSISYNIRHHLPDPYLTSIRTRLIRLMIMDEYINYYLNKPEGQVSDGEDKAMELFPKNKQFL